ncbi:MAG: LacI family transcriptional regulator [Lachnospiraceae bacterium]|nr:LacI family transcriptional regulator [Lachnospiraceae bacterium]
MSRITIADVAEALGISKTTVSRAISGKGRISEETIKKVKEYIEANNYKPNVIAKSLAQSKTYNIAMIIPADCNVSELPFFQSCMYGVCERAAERDYDVLAVYTMGNEAKNLERILINNKIDGVILSRTLVNDRLVKELRDHNLPFVAIGSTEDEQIVRVDHDHRSACRELTSFILQSVHDRVALIGGNNTHMVTRMRYLGFTDAIKAEGLKLHPELIFLNAETPESIEDITEELLRRNAECIVCMDDMICSKVLQKLSRDHVSVPERVKVASFYNSRLLDTHVPAVTSLDFDVQELGTRAADVLLDMIAGKDVPGVTLLPYRITVRETV